MRAGTLIFNEVHDITFLFPAKTPIFPAKYPSSCKTIKMIRKTGYTLALLMLEITLFFFAALFFQFVLSGFNISQSFFYTLEDTFLQATRRIGTYYIFYIVLFSLITRLLKPKRKVLTIAIINASLYILITFAILLIRGEEISSSYSSEAFHLQWTIALAAPFLLNRMIYFRSKAALDIFPELQPWELAEIEIKAK